MELKNRELLLDEMGIAGPAAAKAFADGIADPNIMVKAIDAVAALCKKADMHSILNSILNIEDAFSLPEIADAPLNVEFKYILRHFIYGENSARNYDGMGQEAIWQHYYTGCYEGVEAFIYLYYVYGVSQVGDISSYGIINDAYFLMPDSVRELLPDVIERERKEHNERIANLSTKPAREEGTPDFETVKEHWLNSKKQPVEEYKLIDMIILGLSDDDLKKFITEADNRTKKGHELRIHGLMTTLSGAAAQRIYAILGDEAIKNLDYLSGQRHMTPITAEHHYGAPEAAALLFKLAGDGEITLPGSALDFVNSVGELEERQHDYSHLWWIIKCMDKASLETVAKAAPYELANSTLFKDEMMRRKILEKLPSHIQDFLVKIAHEDKEVSIEYALFNDSELLVQIQMLAEMGKIKAGFEKLRMWE